MGFHALSWYSPMYQAAVSHPVVDMPGDGKREDYEAAPNAYGPKHTLHQAVLILGGGEYNHPKNLQYNTRLHLLCSLWTHLSFCKQQFSVKLWPTFRKEK